MEWITYSLAVSCRRSMIRSSVLSATFLISGVGAGGGSRSGWVRQRCVPGNFVSIGPLNEKVRSFSMVCVFRAEGCGVLVAFDLGVNFFIAHRVTCADCGMLRARTVAYLSLVQRKYCLARQ